MAKQDDEHPEITRRRALQGVGAVVGATALGCSSDSGKSSSGAEPGVDACTSTDGLSAEELLAGIDTFVVLMMENRSFDHFMGSLKLAEDRPIDGLTGSEMNLDQDGVAVPIFPLSDWNTPIDPPHGWDESHAQWNGGANNGFVTQYQVSGGTGAREQVMGYYDRSDLPVHYALADQYVVCDRWFASVMGPTWPNRYYLHCATAGGQMTNDVAMLPSIFDLLAANGISSGYYYSNLPFTATYGGMESSAPIASFFADAAAGTLPNFVIVDPILTAGTTVGNDDHPPADIRDGQMFLSTVYQALAQSPQWERLLFILCYDEHGGFFDHVPPPTTVDDLPEFTQLGFRVPGFVIGPMVRQGCTVSTQFDHVSVIATVSKRFGLPPINARVSATQDLSICIDPKYLQAPRAPAPLPAVHMGSGVPSRRPQDFAGRGQVELAALLDQKGFDWRSRTEEATRVVLQNGIRLGVIRTR